MVVLEKFLAFATGKLIVEVTWSEDRGFGGTLKIEAPLSYPVPPARVSLLIISDLDLKCV